MRSRRGVYLPFLLLAAAVCAGTGCQGSGTGFSGSQPNSVTVNLMMQSEPDAPPAGVSILSFQATLTGATLNPGNVSLIAAPAEIELKRLELETSLVGTANVRAGTYTSVDLIFTNPSLTFQNDTGGTVTVGGTGCASGQICKASPTVVNFAGSVDLPGTGIALSANTPAALLVDLNLSTLLSSTLQANLSGAASVSALAPLQGEPFGKLEDVLGVVSAKNSASGGFTLQTGLGNYSVTVDSNTVFSNFPSSACSSAGSACVANSQIVSADLSLGTDGTLLANRVLFEDSAANQAEIEGIVVATTGQTPPAQFEMVVLQETPSVSGLGIGSVVTVNGQSATFDADQLGWDTSAYTFQGVPDLLVGQEVQVRRLSTSTNTNLDADRIRLRSSRVSANVQIVSLPNFTLSIGSLPQYLQTAGIVALQVQTSSTLTEFAGNAANSTQIGAGNFVSLRGQLFLNGTGTGVLLATKVIKH
jgi:hypothetical protein